MRRWKVVAAPNAYKGACDAPSAAAAMRAGVLAACPEARVVCAPVADGGDGTASVLRAALGGRSVAAPSVDPWGRPRRAGFALLGADRRTAAVDVASASGLHGRRPRAAQSLAATTAGTGLLCRRAAEAGARHIYVSLGGSGTTDGGSGLLAALGARWLDAGGGELPPGGAALARLASADLAGLVWTAPIRITVLVDVANPLLGPTGAARVFGPQKGAGATEVEVLERGLARFADVLERTTGRDARHLPGSGAAGGCGFGLAAALGAELRPGAEAVGAAVGLPGLLAGADLVLTGEGSLDAQTAFGKAPAYVARQARAAGAAAVALAGRLGPGWEALLRPAGDLDAAMAIAPEPRPRKPGLAATRADLEGAAACAMRLALVGARLG